MPANIQRPPYVATGENPWIEEIQVHTKDVHKHNFLSILVDACEAEFTLVSMQELKKMRAACRLGAEVREFAGTLVKVRQIVVQFLSASTAVSATKGD